MCTKSIFSPFMHHLWELVHFKNPTLYLNVVTLSGDGVLYIDVECLCDVLEALEGSTLPSWTCLSDLKSYLTRSSGRASPPQLSKCTCTVTPLGAPKSENSSVLGATSAARSHVKKCSRITFHLCSTNRYQVACGPTRCVRRPQEVG